MSPMSLLIIPPRVLQSCLPLETRVLILVTAPTPDRHHIDPIFEIGYLVAVVLV